MSKVVVVIPIYKVHPSELEIISLVQCCKILNNYPVAIVCSENLNIKVYERILKEHKVNFNVVGFISEYFDGVAGYNRLMLDIIFYEKFKTYEFMLIYQLDAYVFRDELDSWCSKGYDYIGAPWFEDYGLANNKSSLIKYSGNGGFSLRKIESFLRVLGAKGESENFIKKFIKTGNNEDGFFSFHAKKIVSDFNIAPANVAMYFSFECLPGKMYGMTNKKLPFGCHAWEKYDLKFWSSFINVKNGFAEKNMKFSIIICTYNAGNKLSKTLDSILVQSNQDLEVVIVDGASSDGTVDIIKEYEEKFAGKLTWISEKDSGIYNAMNKGVKMAQGEFLNVVGAGDWLEKDALEKATECINKNPSADAVHGKLRVWDEDLKRDYLLQTFPDMLAGNPMQHPALYYKKILHDKFGLYDESYRIVSDYLFCMKAFLIGDAKTFSFDSVVDNYVTDGISAIESVNCLLENERAREELGLNPKVSIIVPTYNQQEYIGETLNCVLEQSYNNWECIIVDDGSIDNTFDVIKKFIDGDARFKYFRQESAGPSQARNYGISVSDGEYILPLDSDDKISKDYVREAVGVLIGNSKVKLVYCEAEYFGSRTGKWELPKYSYDKILFSNMIFCSAIYRKKDFDNTSGYNMNMHEGFEDWDFWISFLEKDDIVYKLPRVHFYYRIKKLSRNLDSHRSDDIIRRMYKQIYLNNEKKYEKFVNPIYNINRIGELENAIISMRNDRKNPFSKLKVYFSALKNNVIFVVFHPKKFIKKYINVILNSKLRQPARKIYYAIRFKKIK